MRSAPPMKDTWTGNGNGIPPDSGRDTVTTAEEVWDRPCSNDSTLVVVDALAVPHSKRVQRAAKTCRNSSWRGCIYEDESMEPVSIEVREPATPERDHVFN